MITTLRGLLLASIFAFNLLPGKAPLFTPAGGELYFPETGHVISGEFLRFYQAADNPLLLYGYPITDAFQDQITGGTFQYFQRVRMELHTGEPEALRVKLSPLGEFLYKPGQPLPLPENFPSCRTFPETGFEVCYSFLEFFDKHGGVATFGYPISNFEIHDERTVQYFQMARFEWHPEFPTGNRVTLTDLGSRYFEAHGENPIRLLARQGDHIPLATVIQLRVRAFPVEPVAALKGQQTVYLVVQDQNLHPVQNATLTLTVTMPSGEQATYTAPPSNEKGIAFVTFPYAGAAPGLAQINVLASFESLEAKTLTSFRLWW